MISGESLAAERLQGPRSLARIAKGARVSLRECDLLCNTSIIRLCHTDTIVPTLLFSVLTTAAITVLSVALNRLRFPFYTGSLCFIHDCHPSLPKISFVLHFEAFT